jgi:integrase
VVVLSITDEGDDDEAGVRSLKNEGSRRQVPIHPALIAEGFLDYIKGLRPGSALFPDTPPDTMFGRRGTNASKAISRWMRGTLKITDTKISPNHSWRHWFIDACRKVRMHPEVRKALTGHTGGQDEGDRYGVGMGSFVGLLAEAIAQVHPPVPPLGAASSGTGGPSSP